MKKLLTLLLFTCYVFAANAQILRADELEEYAKEKYGDKWVDAAENLATQLSLDKNNAITFIQVVQAPDRNKDQLYVLLNYWFTATFNDAGSVIQLNDKELGTIIAQGHVANIAYHVGGGNSYAVGIKPIIKCDIKDDKVRVTYSIPSYSVVRMIGGGWLSALEDPHMRDHPIRSDENWTLDDCFPFKTKRDSHKKTSSKALVMAHAYSNVIMDKIEECVKNGLTGAENDEW